MVSVPQVYRSYHRSPAVGERSGYCPACGAACRLERAAGRTRPVCTGCGRVRYRNPLPGVAVVIREAGRVLLARRRGAWGVPAGFVEYDEDYLSAAHREVREETGLEIELTGLANPSSNFVRPDLHSLVGVVCARRIGGTLRPGDDVDALRWAPLRGAHGGVGFEGDRLALQALAEERLPVLPIDSRFRRSRP